MAILGGLLKTSTQTFSGIYLGVAALAVVAVAMTILLPKDKSA